MHQLKVVSLEVEDYAFDILEHYYIEQYFDGEMFFLDRYSSHFNLIRWIVIFKKQSSKSSSEVWQSVTVD